MKIKLTLVRPIINFENFLYGAYKTMFSKLRLSTDIRMTIHLFIWLFCWFVQIVIGEAHDHILNQSSVNVVKFERVEHHNKLDVHHNT